MKVKYNYNEIYSFLKKNGYELIDNNYKGSHYKITVKDNGGYFYSTSIHDLECGIVPDGFNKSNPYTVQNIKLWCKLNNKPFELMSDEYSGSNKKLKWKCLKKDCNRDFECTWHNIIRNRGCGKCRGRQVDISNCLATKYPELAKEWHPTKNGNLTPYDVTSGSNKKVWWLCSKNPKHEWEVNIVSRSHNKHNCPYCSGNYPSEDYNLLVCNPELAREWNYKKNKKEPKDYTPSSNNKVFWKCKKCDNEWLASINSRNSGKGCPQCNESKGENRIQEFLIRNNFSYDKQYVFDDLLSKLGKLLRFDFGIIDNKNLLLLIEYDGEFHYKKYYKKQNFEILQYHDKLKNDYCNKNNIKLLRIPYWEFDNIEIILSKELLKEAI
jgi:TusA-related sulfurtransferase